MAATEPMLDIALSIRPHACCLVPEKRTERTTEGGLDVIGGHDSLKPFVAELTPRRRARVAVHRALARSARSLRVAARAGGRTAHRRLVQRAGARRSASARPTNSRACAPPRRKAAALGIECHAGHGLDYDTARTIAALPEIVELNIGHFLVGEAIFVGLAETRAADARGDGRGPRGGRDDHRHWQRSLRHPPRRGDAGAFGERFIARCFTDIERTPLGAARGRAASYAKRFAAKEACAKALGTGLRRGVFWRDMGVVNLPCGQPTMRLTGGAAARLAAITPAGKEAFIHLTITDEHPLAQAFVVIEAR